MPVVAESKQQLVNCLDDKKDLIRSITLTKVNHKWYEKGVLQYVDLLADVVIRKNERKNMKGMGGGRREKRR